MLSRRSLFSLFVGAGAIAAGAKVVEAKPLVGFDLAAPGADSTQSYLFRVMKEYGDADMQRYETMSRHFANVKGMEYGGLKLTGQIPEKQSFSIMNDEVCGQPHDYTTEIRCPVNVRADGSIRHRQHHPVDFPPKR